MSLFDSASLIVTPNGYKEDKLYSIKPSDGSGDLVVTRATTATRVNSEGLIEQVPYNLLKYSEQFDNAIWTKASCSITANATTAPNGTTTADLLTGTSTTGYAGQVIPFIGNGEKNASVFVKQGNSNKSQFAIIDVTSASVRHRININWSDGVPTIETQSGSGTLYPIVPLVNGWYKISISAIGIIATNTNEIRCYPSSNVGNENTYFWGVQVENLTSAKEYFPTTDRLDVPRLDYTNSTCPSAFCSYPANE